MTVSTTLQRSIINAIRRNKNPLRHQFKCSLSFYHTTSTVSLSSTTSKFVDPASKQYKYWNREEAQLKGDVGQYAYRIEISPESIVKEAKILSLSGPHDDANRALHEGKLPQGSSLLAIGTNVEEIQNHIGDNDPTIQPNVLFISPSCPFARLQLPKVLDAYPTIEWVHTPSAGIDFLMSDELSSTKYEHIIVTNAKGQFSSSLAEYAMMACSYFAKDLPRLLRQKGDKNWEKFDVQELRGQTMGIVGYGDIGRATAKLASVYGMKIVALRRHPDKSIRDPFCDVVYGTDKKSLNKLMSESDYIVCSAPSTIETRGMVNADAFKAVKEDAVFINLGRGPVVDEKALLESLKNGKLKGAALDVFIEEPLPTSSQFWNLDNVLLSPHNMDQTATFMHEATEFFVNENLPRFICGEELLNPIDKKLGY